MPKTLKYLFDAEFFDGSHIRQTQDDISLLCAPELKKSAFTDVVMRLADVKRFTLVEDALFPNKYTVDLTDGHFEANGVSFKVQGDRPIPNVKKTFRLVYFRDRAESTQMVGRFDNPMSVGEVKGNYAIVDSKGMRFVFPKKSIEKFWSEDVEVKEGDKMVVHHMVYYLPFPPIPTMAFRLGWQTTVAGKNYQETIVIE